MREITTAPQLALGTKAEDLHYRFQWNAPIRISKHDPSVLYHTSNFVHRSTDEGQTWTIVSPDLTRANPEMLQDAGGPITRDQTGVEVFATIFVFEESPLAKGELWAGTDDGRVHLTRDDGRSWTEITPPGVPEFATVNAIDISPHQAGRAHVTVYNYRFDDFAPYVFQTNDYGKSWKRIADGKNGIPARHFARVRARGSRSPRSSLCRHRVRNVRLVRRREELAVPPAQPPRDSGDRSSDQGRGSRALDPGALVLDPRRPHAAPSDDRRRR